MFQDLTAHKNFLIGEVVHTDIQNILGNVLLGPDLSRGFYGTDIDCAGSKACRHEQGCCKSEIGPDLRQPGSLDVSQHLQIFDLVM